MIPDIKIFIYDRMEMDAIFKLRWQIESFKTALALTTDFKIAEDILI